VKVYKSKITEPAYKRHFLSDVVAAAFISIGISVALYNRMIRPGKAASSINNPQNPSDSP